MKKFYLAFVAILLGVTASFAQPVSDHAVIPIGVTLNPVLRIEVTNGGNIEFVFSSLAQYQSGLFGGSLYQTTFRVLSSAKFDVTLFTDPATATDLTGQADLLNLLPMNVIYHDFTGTGVVAATADARLAGVAIGYEVIDNAGPALAGDPVIYTYTIDWQCGVGGGLFTVLGKKPDRYMVNVLLEATPHD